MTETPDLRELVAFPGANSLGWHDAAFDVGVRRGLAAIDPDYAVTAGISIPFAVGRV